MRPPGGAAGLTRAGPVQAGLEEVVSQAEDSVRAQQTLPAVGESQGSVASPRVTEELAGVPLPPPHQPVPQAGVETHQSAVTPPHQNIPHTLVETLQLWPAQLRSDGQGGQHREDLLQAEGLQASQADGEDVGHLDK